MYIAKHVLTLAHDSFYIIVMTAAHKLLISVLSMRTSAQDFKLFIVFNNIHCLLIKRLSLMHLNQEL
jgi:hypothetical protein